MSTQSTAPLKRSPAPPEQPRPNRRLVKLAQFILVERVTLLAVLLVVVVAWFWVLGRNGYLVASFDSDYLASVLDTMVPLCILALAELLVLVSGRGGIDLSVGSIVSVCSMALGFMVGNWGWPLVLALPATILVGALLGAGNGWLIAQLGFPALIATLATYYVYGSLALVSNGSAPISTKPVQDLYALTGSLDLGSTLPNLPASVLTFLAPCVLVVWLVLNRTTYGRRLYAIGTNDVAARFADIDVRRTRFSAYVAAGMLSGVAAVVIVAQFASARPDAGSVGNGMALPAITIAVLGGVLVAGGVGSVTGVVIAALLVVWLNAGILLLFEDSRGSAFQLFALGALLLISALLNAWTQRRGGGVS